MRYRCVEFYEGFTVGGIYLIYNCLLINDDEEPEEISIADLVLHFEPVE